MAATEPLLCLEFGVVFKLSCSPVSAKLYQASFTLLLCNEERGGKQGASLPACCKAPGACRHTDAACSFLLRSGSTLHAKSYSLENGTCAKVSTLIKSSFTPAVRERGKGRESLISSPSPAFSPTRLGKVHYSTLPANKLHAMQWKPLQQKRAAKASVSQLSETYVFPGRKGKLQLPKLDPATQTKRTYGRRGPWDSQQSH